MSEWCHFTCGAMGRDKRMSENCYVANVFLYNHSPKVGLESCPSPQESNSRKGDTDRQTPTGVPDNRWALWDEVRCILTKWPSPCPWLTLSSIYSQKGNSEWGRICWASTCQGPILTLPSGRPRFQVNSSCDSASGQSKANCSTHFAPTSPVQLLPPWQQPRLPLKKTEDTGLEVAEMKASKRSWVKVCLIGSHEMLGLRGKPVRGQPEGQQ